MAETSAPTPQEQAMPSPLHPDRPALTDRRLPRNESVTAQKTARHKSQGKVLRAGTYSNSRLPRSNSSKGGLPRGRSFQGTKQIRPEAQAAQEGYRQRKAAKMYAEKRRAARAEKATDGNGLEKVDRIPDRQEAGGDVINVTVDENGILVDKGRSGMGTRKGSRSKMTRSSSTQRMSRSSSAHRSFRRGEDKENAGIQNLRRDGADGTIEEYFGRKRGAGGRKKAEEISENSGSWDGSMPRRQSTRSFIENARVTDTSKSNDSANVPAKVTNSALHIAEPAVQNVTAKKVVVTSTTSTAAAREQEQASVVNQDKPSSSGLGLRTNEVKPLESEIGKVIVAKLHEDEKDKDSLECKPEQGVCKEVSGARQISMPSSGKWCEECSGLGLHIAALLAELEKHRPMNENGSDSPSASSDKKKGWKSVVAQTVLGSGESKAKSSEKLRMQNEVTILRATVKFLHDKIEAMERTAPKP